MKKGMYRVFTLALVTLLAAAGMARVAQAASASEIKK